MAERRASFFRGKICIDCGSDQDLELDHVVPADKIDHKIWSWSEVRRNEELAKCVVRCEDCHKKKTAVDVMAPHGRVRYEKHHCRCGICVAAKEWHNARRTTINGKTVWVG